jgi:hypothetical protein
MKRKSRPIQVSESESEQEQELRWTFGKKQKINDLESDTNSDSGDSLEDFFDTDESIDSIFFTEFKEAFEYKDWTRSKFYSMLIDQIRPNLIFNASTMELANKIINVIKSDNNVSLNIINVYAHSDICTLCRLPRIITFDIQSGIFGTGIDKAGSHCIRKINSVINVFDFIRNCMQNESNFLQGDKKLMFTSLESLVEKTRIVFYK